MTPLEGARERLQADVVGASVPREDDDGDVLFGGRAWRRRNAR